jgi:hypothetical protein
MDEKRKTEGISREKGTSEGQWAVGSIQLTPSIQGREVNMEAEGDSRLVKQGGS